MSTEDESTTPGTPESLFRCPIDPSRQSPLTRVEGGLGCECGCVFPIRNSIPILIPDEAELPKGCRGIDRLPCRR